MSQNLTGSRDLTTPFQGCYPWVITCYYIYTLFRKNVAYSNTLHHYTKLKQYSNTHNKTKVKDKIIHRNTFAE